jgi:hypothetical protein
VNPEIPGHLGDRLTCLSHDPAAPSLKSGSNLRRVSGIATPLGDASTERGAAQVR